MNWFIDCFQIVLRRHNSHRSQLSRVTYEIYRESTRLNAKWYTISETKNLKYLTGANIFTLQVKQQRNTTKMNDNYGNITISNNNKNVIVFAWNNLNFNSPKWSTENSQLFRNKVNMKECQLIWWMKVNLIWLDYIYKNAFLRFPISKHFHILGIIIPLIRLTEFLFLRKKIPNNRRITTHTNFYQIRWGLGTHLQKHVR